ncbi:unnamed protein product [Arabidopsis halleri]
MVVNSLTISRRSCELKGFKKATRRHSNDSGGVRAVTISFGDHKTSPT